MAIELTKLGKMHINNETIKEGNIFEIFLNRRKFDHIKGHLTFSKVNNLYVHSSCLHAFFDITKITKEE